MVLACLLVPAPAAPADSAAKYTGPGSCGSTSCHGGVRPRSDNAVLQNEFTTWTLQDKHARAASVLTNKVGKRMGEILGVNPQQSPKCLVCHSLNIAEDRKTRSFDTGDGVSCESCHGPASNWLGPHTTRGWKYEQGLQLGMRNTRDLIGRAEVCLGLPSRRRQPKSVDHEMIAAGHPDLYFELDSFSAAMPPHWKEKDKDPWIDLRALATGQAVQLRENMRRIARDVKKFWPEYSELDCQACHHNLVGAEDSWRQARGYPGRRPGNPPWNSSRYVVFRVILNQIDADSAARLDASIKRVDELVTDVKADPAQISQAASAAAVVADEIARRMPGLQLDGAAGWRLMKAITASADRIAGRRQKSSAEQATMVLDSLFIASNRGARVSNAQQISGAVSALFQLVENPSAYNPEHVRSTDAKPPARWCRRCARIDSQNRCLAVSVCLFWCALQAAAAHQIQRIPRQKPTVAVEGAVRGL